MPAVGKPQHNRRTRKQRNLTHITDKVREEVLRRSEGFCERCGRWALTYGGEMAHLIQAGQLGRGDQPWNIVLLCGPSVNSGTCHNFADHTRAGREWRMEKRMELVESYQVQACDLCGGETVVYDATGLPICDRCEDLYPERM